MVRLISGAIAILAGLAAIPTAPARAEEARDPRLMRGEQEYRDACAVCHGIAGDGNGPIASMLRVAPSDLRGLTVGNGGSFPFDRVYGVIDGRAPVPGHGPSDMPIWGREFTRDAERAAQGQPVRPDPELVVAGRILVVIDYLKSLQQE